MSDPHPHHITTERTGQHVRVSIDGVIVADSADPVVLHEGNLPPRYYMPLDDVQQEFLRPSTKGSHCPFKGDASYWSVEVNGTTHEDVVWTYTEPLPGRRDITGLVAFYNDRVELSVD